MQPDMNNAPDTCIESATAADLLELMSVDDEADVWSEEDLEAIWQHQLQADLVSDFHNALKQEHPNVSDESSFTGPGRKTIGDFFSSENATPPDLDTIDDLKRFAKSVSKKQNFHLPQDICAALYYLAIASAFVWHGKRISKLSDESLKQGMNWTISRKWLDPETSRLFQKCSEMIEA